MQQTESVLCLKVPIIPEVTLVMFYCLSLLLMSALYSRPRHTVHPGVQRFIIDRKALSHYCTLCAQIDWPPALSIHWPVQLLYFYLWGHSGPAPVIIHAAHISGKLRGNDCLRSQEAVSLSVPEVQTELGRGAFMYSVTSARKARAKWIWNERAGLSWRVKTIWRGLEAAE